MDSVTPLYKNAATYLRHRGISQEQIELLGIEILSSSKIAELAKLGKFPFRGSDLGVMWHIWDFTGEDTGSYGIRLIYPTSGFTGIVARDLPKLVSPKKQQGRLYHPRICKWGDIQDGDRVYVCESWLKADIMALHGEYAVGIQGIWGWSGSEPLLNDFKRLVSLGVQFVCLFDSNVYPGKRANVKAVESLHAELSHMGSKCGYIRLPPKIEGEGEDRVDWGIDDFLVARGQAGLAGLLGESPVVEVETSGTREVRIFDREVVYIKELDRIYDLKGNVPYTANSAIKSRWANRNFTVMVEGDGKAKAKLINVARAWVEWSERREVRRLAYLPGREKVVEGEFVNAWDGLGCEPIEGSVELFTSWCDHAFGEHSRWFQEALAWPLQNMQDRSTMALVVLGESGVGKGWLAELLRCVYGEKNYAKITLNEFVRHFNTHWAMRQFVVVEEAGSANTKERAEGVNERVKDYVTETVRNVTPKGVNTFEVEAVGHLMIQGNDISALRIDEFDRRMAVFWVDGEGVANNGSYWDPRWAWLSQGGPEAMLDYFLSLEIKEFQPHGTPPRTIARQNMIEATRNSQENWLLDVKGGEPLHYMGKALEGRAYTALELTCIYRNELPDMVPDLEVKRMQRALDKMNWPQALTPAGTNKVTVKPKKGEHNPWPPMGGKRYYIIEGSEIEAHWVDHIRSRNINKIIRPKG